MGKIIKMSPELYGMIAAGEVVERPVSVVKELVENSIDAKAKSIDVYLRDGGLSYIKIVDDGEGMDKDDVMNAFQPHATSKIKNGYDLLRIKTLGFRGEAIYSISSVSRMTITSSTTGGEGYSATYKYANYEKSGVESSNKGTSVTVENLFVNTPARLKYMKSAKSELASILFFIDRISMAHSDIKFRVYNDDKQIFQTSGSSNYQTLIGELYSVDAARKTIDFEYLGDGYKAHIVFVKPEVYRSNKLEITIICNGRWVKNYNLTNAFVEAFDTYLPIGKYPIGIIDIDIDPLLIDVNIHPAKTEIKISNEDQIATKLKNEVNLKLRSLVHIPSRNINQNQGYVKTTIFNEIDTKPKALNEDFTPIYNKDEYVDLFGSNKTTEPEVKEEIKTTKEIVEDNVELTVEHRQEFPMFEYVGQIFGTYLIFQNSEGMYLVDQHAAAERINYEKYYKILGDANQPKTELLVPIRIDFTKEEALYVEENNEAFSDIGFELDSIGDNSYLLRMVPLWAKIDNLESIIYDILAKMIENKKVDVIYFRNHIAKQISCKASIKANHAISKNEIDYLIEHLKECDNPFTCPHGRPTIIKITVSELERMFERIQK
ncbi:MAG: DNA mismatch repair endonuclease MutL [Acholeplasmatales bacterium]|nr:DNA mismatch repair endonuclease MutL [Acholeplasmatales bacterium]